MSQFYKFALWMQRQLRALLMRIFGILPVKRDKAVFVSFGGKAYSDNPKAISEALHRRMPEADIVWLFLDPEKKRAILPEYVRSARIHSPRALMELSTAAVWVNNMPMELYTKKRARQFYMQTWHGDRGFKKMLYDAPDHPAGKPILEERICDVMSSGSTFCEGTYHTGFGYHGEILKTGSARNDALINPPPDKINEVRRALGLSPDDKVLLYAPTMRNESRRKGERQPIRGIDLLSTLSCLEARLGGQFVCLVRGHSATFGLQGLPESGRVKDVSSHEDMADLLLIADVLITDYSSSAGDFALTGRPVVLFQEDREGFAKNERTFYFDIDQSPYAVVRSQSELETHIARLNPESAEVNDRAILEFYGAYETGRAAETAAELLAQHMC